jgi:hypothetical protein
MKPPQRLLWAVLKFKSLSKILTIIEASGSILKSCLLLKKMPQPRVGSLPLESQELRQVEQQRSSSQFMGRLGSI